MTSRRDNPFGRQRGLSTVEFAIVGSLVFLVLLGVIEASRAAFSRAMIEEGVRRAARLAAVCPLNDPYITNAARFTERNWGTNIIPTLTASMVTLQYLDENAVWIPDPLTNFTSIRFVRVTTAGYEIPLHIPFVKLTYKPGPLSSTQPAESLGVQPMDKPPCY